MSYYHLSTSGILCSDTSTKDGEIQVLRKFTVLPYHYVTSQSRRSELEIFIAVEPSNLSMSAIFSRQISVELLT